MHPLPTHTVDLLLHLISPLSDPLPNHLISTPLQQRHHFLQISPSSPVEYLCWPSTDNAEIIDLLDRLPPPSDHALFQTRYTSDSESTFAHVQISSDAQGLRMLFHWDDTDGWKYHDLRLMPFPSPSYLTPQESLASSSVAGAADASRPPSTSVDQINGGDDDDSYWDAYGAAGYDSTSSMPLHTRTDATEGEDAYWAQYSSVQGSADSTVPSPLPTHCKLRPAGSTDDESAFPSPSQNNPVIFDVPVNAIHSRLHTSRQEPPSPNTLAHLLSMISPRKETYSPVLDDPSDLQHQSSALTPERTATESELVTPPLPNGYLDAPNVAFKLNGIPLSQCHSPPQDTALADSIRGLYFLWKAGRKGDPDDKDQSVFLGIVQTAIAHD